MRAAARVIADGLEAPGRAGRFIERARGYRRAAAQVEHQAADVLDAEQLRALQIGPRGVNARQGAFAVGFVEIDLRQRQELEVVLQVEALLRPARHRLGDDAARAGGIVGRDPRQVGQARAHVDRGEQVAALERVGEHRRHALL